MFKSAVIFRIRTARMPSASLIEAELEKRRFAPCGASQMESFGWVQPRGEKHGPFQEAIGGQYILQMMTESKILPGSVVKEMVQARLDKIQEETGHRPKGKRAKEVKEEVIQELLPKSFTRKKSVRMWVNPVDKFILVEAGTPKAAERIIQEYARCLFELDPDLAIGDLSTNQTPAQAMTTWLTTQDAPEDFTVDRDCELKGTDEEKATVRYTRHTLDIKEIVDHINQGKTPTKLAMTFDSRVSFMLGDNLSLKKIELLDVVMDDAGPEKGGFDADVAIFTGEMVKFVPALVKALSGETSPDSE